MLLPRVPAGLFDPHPSHYLRRRVLGVGWFLCFVACFCILASSTPIPSVRFLRLRHYARRGDRTVAPPAPTSLGRCLASIARRFVGFT